MTETNLEQRLSTIETRFEKFRKRRARPDKHLVTPIVFSTCTRLDETGVISKWLVGFACKATRAFIGIPGMGERKDSGLPISIEILDLRTGDMAAKTIRVKKQYEKIELNTAIDDNCMVMVVSPQAVKEGIKEVDFTVIAIPSDSITKMIKEERNDQQIDD